MLSWQFLLEIKFSFKCFKLKNAIDTWKPPFLREWKLIEQQMISSRWYVYHVNPTNYKYPQVFSGIIPKSNLSTEPCNTLEIVANHIPGKICKDNLISLVLLSTVDAEIHDLTVYQCFQLSYQNVNMIRVKYFIRDRGGSIFKFKNRDKLT